MYQTQSCFSQARKIVQSATRNVPHPKTYQRNGWIETSFIWHYCRSPSESRLHIRFRKVSKL